MPASIPTSLLILPHVIIPVEIRNLSESGFCAASPGMIPIGARALLWIPGEGEFAAEIRWALGGSFGAQFTIGQDDASQEAIRLLASRWSAGIPAEKEGEGQSAGL